MKSSVFLRHGLALVLAFAVLMSFVLLTSAQPESTSSSYESSEISTSVNEIDSETEETDSDIATENPVESEVISDDSGSSESNLHSSDASGQQSSDTSALSNASSLLSSSAVTTSTVAISSARVSSAAAAPKPSQPTPTISPEWSNELDTMYNNACDWLKQRQDGELFFIAMGGAGRSIDSKQYGSFLNTVSEHTYTELYPLSLTAINATFCGVQATDVNGIDLIDQIVRFPNIADCDAKSLAYALIALDSNPYNVPEDAPNSRQDFVDSLLKLQNEDGMFLHQEDEDDISITAICLSALSSYNSSREVKTALNNGVSYLQEQFQSTAFQNVSSTVLSRVIVALTCLNININDSRFAYKNQNLYELLQKYLGSDNGFKMRPDDPVSDSLSTESAIIALTAIKYFTSPYVIRQSLPESVSSADQFRGLHTSDWRWWLLLPGGVLLIGGAAALTVILKKRKTPTTGPTAPKTDSKAEKD